MAKVWNEKLESVGYDEVWSGGEIVGDDSLDEDYDTANVGSPPTEMT